MKISHICFENRMGNKLTINVQYIGLMVYSAGNVPIITFDCGVGNPIIQAGAKLPSQDYEPRRDTTSVEIFYEDGTSEKPYPKGHVDLADLYDRLCHTTNVTENASN